MDDGRFPKDLLFGELTKGKRPQARHKQCFRNVCRKDLRDCGIEVNDWETLADNRPKWKLAITNGVSSYEATMRKEADERRIRRKERQAAPLRQGSRSGLIRASGGKACTPSVEQTPWHHVPSTP